MKMDRARLIGSKNMNIVLFIAILLFSITLLALQPAEASSTRTADNSNTNDGDYEVVDGYDGYASANDAADERSLEKFKDDLFQGSLLITITVILLCLYFYTRKGKPLPTKIRVKPRNDFYYHNTVYNNPSTSTAPDYGKYDQQYKDMYGPLERKY